jgi:hypothetical protein
MRAKKVMILWNSLLTKLKSSSRVLTDANNVVSSANSKLYRREAWGKSFMKIGNSNGSKTNPCGTPLEIYSKVDSTSPKLLMISNI